ncbi:MAG: hypothetical protein H0W56_00545 [Acidothermales bacterium]|nr:hypothetical protein [Acidothermales bacterium]
MGCFAAGRPPGALTLGDEIKRLLIARATSFKMTAAESILTACRRVATGAEMAMQLESGAPVVVGPHRRSDYLVSAGGYGAGAAVVLLAAVGVAVLYGPVWAGRMS